jgi:hypothetical protein
MFLSPTIRIDSPVPLEQVTHCLTALTEDGVTLHGETGLLATGTQRYPIRLTTKAPWHLIGVWLSGTGWLVRSAPLTQLELSLQPDPLRRWLLMIFLPVALVLMLLKHDGEAASAIGALWSGLVLEFYLSTWVIARKLRRCLANKYRAVRPSRQRAEASKRAGKAGRIV